MPCATENAEVAAPAPIGTELWRSAPFVTTVVGASLIQASHAVLYGFATLQWSSKGIDGTTIGLLWSLGVAAEIALFGASARIVARLGGANLILVGGLGAVVRWTAMGLDPPVLALPALQLLHALSFGATHLGAMDMLSKLADRRSATAQGDFAAVQGGTFAAAMGASGSLVAALGSAAYFAMAGVAAAGFVIALGAQRGRRGSYPA